MAEEYSSPLELISKTACIDFIKKIYKNKNQRHLLIEKDEKSLSLIQYAAIYDRADIIRQLCSLFNEQSHELLNIKDEHGLTLAHYAANNINNDCLNCLVELGASSLFNEVDIGGMTPGHYAAEENNLEGLVIIYKAGYKESFSIKDHVGRSTAYLCIFNCNLFAIKFLASIDVNLFEGGYNLIETELNIKNEIKDIFNLIRGLPNFIIADILKAYT